MKLYLLKNKNSWKGLGMHLTLESGEWWPNMDKAPGSVPIPLKMDVIVHISNLHTQEIDTRISGSRSSSAM